MTPKESDGGNRAIHGKQKLFVRALREEWKRNQLSDAAAALTFYGVLALFPFLLFTVALAGLILQPADVAALIGALGRDVPPAFSELLYLQLEQLTSGSGKGLLTTSALAAVWSASAGVVSLMTALNAAYGVKETRTPRRRYTIALTMVLTGSVLALLAGFVAVAVPALAGRLGQPWTTLVGWLNLPVAALLMMLLWGTLYSVLPNTQHRFTLITPGSVVGVLVWLAASLGFSSYISRFGTFGITYGALAGIVVLLLWMWISSLALMLGAEINAVRSRRRHSAGQLTLREGS